MVYPPSSGARLEAGKVIRGKSLLTFGLAATALLAGGCFTATAPGDQLEELQGVTAAKPCVSPEEADRMAEEVLELLNLERAQHDLSPVVANPQLTKAAEDFGCRMIAGKFFAHRDPESGDGPAERAVKASYRFYSVGENLAAGPSSASEVMKLWMESPPHRSIILDPTWREVGIAVRTGGEHSIYWVQEFGDPADF